VYWEEGKVYWEARMTFICEQILNPRMTFKSEQREWVAICKKVFFLFS
jgi:hypothetical protein